MSKAQMEPATTTPDETVPARVERRSAVREVATLALLPALISVLMLWRALLGLGVFAPTDIVAAEPLVAGRSPEEPRPMPQNPLLTDVVDTFLPWRLLAREQLAAGRFPLWNPYSLFGTHLHGNLQSAVLSPYNLIWYLLPPLWGLGAVAALKWTLGGLGMALLLRRLGLGIGPAIFGSVAFQLSGPVVAWLQWPIAEGLLWVPWMMWAALGWIETLKPLWLAALAAFVAAELLAGHVETAFHSLIFLGAFASAECGSRIAEYLRSKSTPHSSFRIPRLLGGLAFAALLGLALAAAQFLPFLDVLPRSYQWWLRAQPGVPVSELALPTSAALMWLSPNGFGWPTAYTGPFNWIEANPYVGTLTLLLASFALPGTFWRNGRIDKRSVLSPRLPFFWLLVLAATASMSYAIPPLSYLRKLPGFNTSFNWRLISLAGFCLVVLAAMGLERVLNAEWGTRTTFGPRIRNSAFRVPHLVMGAFALAGLLSLYIGARVWWTSSLDVAGYTRAWKGWAFALFCAGAVLVLARLLGWVKPRTLVLLAIGLLTLDMARAHWNFNPTVDRATFYPTNSLLRFAAERGPTERVAVVGRQAWANMLVPMRVPDYRLYDATIDNRYMTFMRLMSPETFREAFRLRDDSLTTHFAFIQPRAELLAQSGIRWLIAPISDDPNAWQDTPEEQPPDGRPVYTRVMDNGAFAIWENRFAHPFTYFPTFYKIAPDEGIVERRLRANRLDATNQIHIEDPGKTLPADFTNEAPPVAQGESVRVESYAPGEIVLRATPRRARLAVVGESWAPHWRATVDGQPAPIYRVNYVLQGVVVPPGEHTIRFVYDPPSFRWGVGISLAALAAWLGLVAWGVIRWRREQRVENLDAS